MTTTQAPCTNLVPAMTTMTTPVVTPPVRLISILTCHPGSWLSYQWRTIPSWDRVNERNTPTA